MWLVIAGISIIISALVTGAIADTIARQKNRNGFLLGFLLSWLGVIIVACMPKDNSYNSKSKYEKLEQLQKLRESKAITEQEFEEEKQNVLNS